MLYGGLPLKYYIFVNINKISYYGVNFTQILYGKKMPTFAAQAPRNGVFGL